MGTELQPDCAETAGRIQVAGIAGRVQVAEIVNRVQVAELTNGTAKDFECFSVKDPDRMSNKRKGLCASIAEEFIF